MDSTNEKLHTYSRRQNDDGTDSLGIIADRIPHDKTILDLGMGTGMLGKILVGRSNAILDGVTYNADERELGRAWYRAVHVIDLDEVDLLTVFPSGQYDRIVCADVLEHLKRPELVLRACQKLLKPDGKLIVSIPNLSYCGLLAELIQGDFRYRQEGLLDSTHLKFFTRRSLNRFFADAGWSVTAADATQRQLAESEFGVAFDSLPPAVARYLLALPDAYCYQFIWELASEGGGATVDVGIQQADAFNVQRLDESFTGALFSAQLYLQQSGAYEESSKLVSSGKIGVAKQTITFGIDPSMEPYSGLRLDPADRPGFFRVHQLKLTTGDVGAWEWASGVDDVSVLLGAVQQQMAVAFMPEFFAGALWLLQGDDPWIELPIPSEVLQTLSRVGGKLDIVASWPMSADYLQAAFMMNATETSQKLESAAFRISLAEVRNINSELTLANDEKQRLLLESESARLAALREGQRLQADLVAAEVKAQADLVAAEVKAQADFAAAEVKAQADFQLQVAALKQTFVKQRTSLLGELDLVKTAVQQEKFALVTESHRVQKELAVVQAQFNQIARHVEKMERSRLFRATRPLSRLKAWVDRALLGEVSVDRPVSMPRPLPAAEGAAPMQAVDIIVPVYKGLADTRRCLESVLAADCQLVWRLIVINDCSPDPEIGAWLQEFCARDSRIALLENETNLGFVATVNRGMAFNTDSDVILLNSDTEVANDWLDRLARAAASSPLVGTVTPFSNNATIFSYPKFCASNNLPSGYDTATLDALFARYLAGQTLDVPTGVGFCMYITRACLKSVGLFDVANFGKGYGEENDFCVRAEELGWRNLHAMDTFVLHAGGVSFGDSKGEREIQAMNTLRRLHPDYEREVHAYVAKDPAKFARLAIDIARIVNKGLPVALNVLHDREGGTLRHVEELVAHLEDRVTFLRMTPSPGGVTIKAEGPGEVLSLVFALPVEWDALVATLGQLGTAHIHFHHLLGYSAQVLTLPDALGVSHDFTAHDYYSYCPQISLTDASDRYCGEKGLDQCNSCLKINPAPSGENIVQWRERHAKLLARARYVIAPSEDAGRRIQKSSLAANVVVASHDVLLDVPPVGNGAAAPRSMDESDRLRIVVLGALSKIKGADLLEDVAVLAAQSGAKLDFHLLGYAYRELRSHPDAFLTVHGKYEDSNLKMILEALKPDLIWFPAVWPETFSYTLSAGIESRLPIVAPNLGAFHERLIGTDWVWECDWSMPPAQWLEFFQGIRVKNFLTGMQPERLNANDESDLVRAPAFAYRGAYADQLPAPTILSEQALWQLVAQLLQRASNGQDGKHREVGFKAVLLKSIAGLRRTRFFSRIVRSIPAHRQRRIKSWLSK